MICSKAASRPTSHLGSTESSSCSKASHPKSRTADSKKMNDHEKTWSCQLPSQLLMTVVEFVHTTRFGNVCEKCLLSDPIYTTPWMDSVGFVASVPSTPRSTDTFSEIMESRWLMLDLRIKGLRKENSKPHSAFWGQESTHGSSNTAL